MYLDYRDCKVEVNGMFCTNDGLCVLQRDEHMGHWGNTPKSPRLAE